MILTFKGFEFDPNDIDNIECRRIPDGTGGDLGIGLWIHKNSTEDVKIPIGTREDAEGALKELITILEDGGYYASLD